MTILSMAGQKGGTGKSVTALCVGCELYKRGAKVLIVDADPQRTAGNFGTIAKEQGFEVPEIRAQSSNLSDSGQILYVAQKYDWTIIDCPPRLDKIESMALHMSNIALLPYSPAGSESLALWSSVELVKRIQAKRPHLFAGIFLTRLLPTTVYGRRARDAAKVFELPILASSFGHRIAFCEFIESGQGITDYTPRGAAADEVRTLVDELEKISRAQKTGTSRRQSTS